MPNGLPGDIVCFIALYRDGLVGYTWAAVEVDPKLEGAAVRLQPGDAYIGFVFTVPAYRGQGVAPALAAHRSLYLKEIDYQRTIGIVDVKNHAALELGRKLGNQTIGRATFRRIFW